MDTKDDGEKPVRAFFFQFILCPGTLQKYFKKALTAWLTSTSVLFARQPPF
jgi:hypothetical protein